MPPATFFKRDRRGSHAFLPRHLHAAGHLALVLSGGYEEAGDRGCFRVQAGDVVLHDTYEAHVDRFASNGADVLDLGVPNNLLPLSSAHVTFRIANPDEIATLAERDPTAASARLISLLQPVERRVHDWPHQLADDMQSNPHLRLDDWASDNRLAPATISRGFQQVFGITPSAYRAHQRARLALRLTITATETLSTIAFTSGFSDQAHMTRAVHHLTGRPPGSWRRSLKAS
ncbi:MAG: AraC family transcriptional regulator [Acidobacteriota bacterium]